MSAPASLAAWATASALPGVLRGRRSGARSGWPGRAAAWPGRAGAPGRGSCPARPTCACGRSSLAVGRSGWSTTASSPNTMTPGLVPGLHAADRLRGEPVGALARGQADAVRHVEQEDDVQPVDPPRELSAWSAPGEQHREQRAAQLASAQRSPRPHGPRPGAPRSGAASRGSPRARAAAAPGPRRTATARAGWRRRCLRPRPPSAEARPAAAGAGGPTPSASIRLTAHRASRRAPVVSV